MPTVLSIVQRYFPKVKKVNDGKKHVRIEVTPQDNAHAKVRDHSACAMAVACKRMLNLDGVIVSMTMAYLVKGDTATRYALPESISREVVSFDRNAGFDEGVYFLSKPRSGDRLGDRADRDRNDKNGSSKKKPKEERFTHLTNGVRAALGSKVAPDGVRRVHG